MGFGLSGIRGFRVQRVEVEGLVRPNDHLEGTVDIPTLFTPAITLSREQAWQKKSFNKCEPYVAFPSLAKAGHYTSGIGDAQSPEAI